MDLTDADINMRLNNQPQQNKPYKVKPSEHIAIQPSLLIRVTNTLFKAVTKTFDGMITTKIAISSSASKNDPSTNSAMNNSNNESICAELIRGNTKKSFNEAPTPATFRYNREIQQKPINESKTDRTNFSVINKSEIRIETNGRIEEQQCVICCEAKTNAVLMPCCHGGICYKCAVKIFKQKPVCHFCRKPVLQVLKICIDEQSTDFFKISDKYDTPNNGGLLGNIKQRYGGV